MHTAGSLLVHTAISAALGLGLGACGGGGGPPPTEAAPVDRGLRLQLLGYAQVMSRSALDLELRLTPGRPTLVRAFVTPVQAARASPDVTLTVVRGTAVLGKLAMIGPPTLPADGELDRLHSTFNATVPAAWAEPGVSFQVVVDAADAPPPLLATRRIGRPTQLQLVVVPLSLNGVVAAVPSQAQFHAVLARASTGADGGRARRRLRQSWPNRRAGLARCPPPGACRRLALAYRSIAAGDLAAPDPAALLGSGSSSPYGWWIFQAGPTDSSTRWETDMSKLLLSLSLVAACAASALAAGTPSISTAPWSTAKNGADDGGGHGHGPGHKAVVARKGADDGGGHGPGHKAVLG